MTKILMHIECLRGTGELTIAARIAEALADRGIDVVVVSGNRRNFFKTHPHITYVDLPPISYDDKVTHDYMAGDRPLSSAPDVLHKRAEELKRTFDKEKPDAVLLSYWPFGNGQNPNSTATRGMEALTGGILDYEMEELIKHIDKKVPIFGSIREVLHVDSLPHRGGDGSAAASMINEHFAQLFVHGDPKIIPFTDTFPYLEKIDLKKISYTGYVTAPPAKSNGAPKDTIIINAGGGDYRPSSQVVLMQAIQSLKEIDSEFLKGKKVRIFVGNSFDEKSVGTLKKKLAEIQPYLEELGVQAEIQPTRALDEYQALLQQCALFIGQAGIGSIMDIITYHYPAVVVPVEEDSAHVGYNFKEQLVRAEELAKSNILGVVHQRELIPSDGYKELAEQINTIIKSPAQNRQILRNIDCGGAQNTANAICKELGVEVPEVINVTR